jgi:hypothetical protein
VTTFEAQSVRLAVTYDRLRGDHGKAAFLTQCMGSPRHLLRPFSLPTLHLHDLVDQSMTRLRESHLAVIYERLKTMPDHEAHMRVLESTRSRLIGALTVITLLVSALGTWLSFTHL